MNCTLGEPSAPLPPKPSRTTTPPIDTSTSKTGKRGALRWGLRLLLLGLLAATISGGIAWWNAASLLASDLVRPRNSGFEAPEVPEEVDHHLRVSHDGIELDVWAIEAKVPKPDGAVDIAVVLHGVADHKGSMMPLGRRFSLAGVRVAMVDLRGHGSSTETEITYGVRDREDLSAVLDALREELGWQDAEVGVYGPSYGGAVALQWSAHEPRVKRVFNVASFASMHRIVRPYIEHTWASLAESIPTSWSDEVVNEAGRSAGFDPNLASPIDAIARSQARHVIVHSRDDEIVPFQHSVDMAEACGERCELIPLEGKTHLESMSNVPLRLASYELIVGSEFPGDEELRRRFEALQAAQ